MKKIIFMLLVCIVAFSCEKEDNAMDKTEKEYVGFYLLSKMNWDGPEISFDGVTTYTDTIPVTEFNPSRSQFRPHLIKKTLDNNEKVYEGCIDLILPVMYFPNAADNIAFKFENIYLGNYYIHADGSLTPFFQTDSTGHIDWNGEYDYPKIEVKPDYIIFSGETTMWDERVKQKVKGRLTCTFKKDPDFLKVQ